MSLIQCKLGPRQVSVSDHTYDFRADEKGRHVAQVHNLLHQTIFLSVDHYAVVTDDDGEEDIPAAQRDTSAPATAEPAAPIVAIGLGDPPPPEEPPVPAADETPRANEAVAAVPRGRRGRRR